MSASAFGQFIELPGPAPDLESRRMAFRGVMRRLLQPLPDDEPKSDEQDDDAADAA